MTDENFSHNQPSPRAAWVVVLGVALLAALLAAFMLRNEITEAHTEYQINRTEEKRLAQEREQTRFINGLQTSNAEMDEARKRGMSVIEYRKFKAQEDTATKQALMIGGGIIGGCFIIAIALYLGKRKSQGLNKG